MKTAEQDDWPDLCSLADGLKACDTIVVVVEVLEDGCDGRGAIYGTVPSIPDIQLGATTRVGVVTFHGHEVRASTLARWRSR